jgi:hypothetical protein
LREKAAGEFDDEDDPGRVPRRRKQVRPARAGDLLPQLFLVKGGEENWSKRTGLRESERLGSSRSCGLEIGGAILSRMEQASEISEAREIEISLVFCSVYLGFTVGNIVMIVERSDWKRMDLGICFLVMAVLGVFRGRSKIKEIFRDLLTSSSSAL